MSDKIWQGEPARPPPADGLMNYWPEGLLPLEMDDLGLSLAASQPVATEAAPVQPLQHGVVDEAVLRKRKRERADHESVESILAQLGREEDEDSPYEDKRPQRTTSGSKATAASAARNKACRERQRRERLNDRFAELAKVLEPGKTAKTDKTNIIDDAMRIVTQLRGENGQLRQLNKFLEERVAQCEKAKNELLLQQALMQQSTGITPGPSHLLANAAGQLFRPPHMASGLVQGVAVGLPAMQAMQAPAVQPPQQSGQAPSQPMQQGTQPQDPVAGQVHHAHQPVVGASLPQPQLHPPPAQGTLQSQASLSSQASLPHALPQPSLPISSIPSLTHPGMQVQGLSAEPGAPDSTLPFPKPTFIKQEFSSGLMLPGGLPFSPTMSMSSWLPPSTLDTSQDSIRRPPAA